MPQLRTPPKAQSAKYLKKIYFRREKFLTIKYFIAQIVVANFVWNFRIFSYKCCLAEHVMVQMFPYLLLPNSQLYSSEAAAAIAR